MGRTDICPHPQAKFQFIPPRTRLMRTKSSPGGPAVLVRIAALYISSLAGISPLDLYADEPGDPHNKPDSSVIDNSLAVLESFSAATENQLKGVAQLVGRAARLSANELRPYAAEDCLTFPLRPRSLQTVFADQRIEVRRAAEDMPPNGSVRGLSGLSEQLRRLVEPFHGLSDVHVKFKLFRVQPADDHTISTDAYFHAWASSAERVVEQTSRWRVDWSILSTREPPKITSVTAHDFEEVVTLNGGGVSFVDSTLAAFGRSAVFHDQLMFGIEHWRNRLPADVEIDFRGHHGIAIADVNGDGLEDIYLCQPHGLPDRLFVQAADGTVSDVSAAAGIDWLDESKSALLLDLDNDLDQDLVLCVEDRLLVMANDGAAHFSLAAELKGPSQPHSVTAADYDQDGWLDLYVCGFWLVDLYEASQLQAAFALPTPWHDANNGAPNVLYRNLGKLRFHDATEESGLNENNRRFSHAAGWEDFDNDGDMDLYVANDYGRNNLYRNDAGLFVDVAAELGVEDQAAGMSVAWSDYDNDGWMDLYVSNMFSSAGGRISYHSKFQRNSHENVKQEFRRHARGNTLFRNSPQNHFRDVSEPAAVVLGRWAWSSNFLDINNDGLDDLFVANGFVTNEDTKDL